jgi:hypothetical protein
MYWDGFWYDELQLPVNETLSFRFVVDGQWRVSEAYPKKTLDSGLVNQIQIDDGFPVASEKKFNSERIQRNTGSGKPVEVSSPEELLKSLKEGKDVILSSKLKSLCISAERLSEEESLRLIKALKGSNVEILNLSHNYLGAKGAKCLSDLLPSSSIQELYLWSTQIGDEGAKALAEALANTSKLRSLQLRSNSISQVGASSLAKALLSNKSLRLFDLWSNDIGAAFMDFARVVASHPALEELHLTPPEKIPDKKAGATWENAINSNKTLTDLHIFNLDKRPFQLTVERIISRVKQ